MRSAIFAVAVLLVTVQSFAICPDPGPNQVVFYQHAGFSTIGKCVVKNIGNFPTSSRLGIDNDSISSIKIGSAVQVLVCRDAWYEGRCELFTASEDQLSKRAIGNDTISSAKVQPLGASTTCEPASNQVAFFHDAVFGGACEVRGIGDYRHSEDIGLSNDSISSIKIGFGVHVVLCRDANFGGTCETFTESDSNLSDNRIGNDTVSSAHVQRRAPTRKF